MPIRKTVALAGAVATAAGATALIAVPALASSATSAHATHTLTFTAVPSFYHYYNKAQTPGIEVDKDISAGKVAGANIVDFVSATKNDVSIGLRRGFLNGVFTVSSTGTITGKINSGTGAYRGAMGTIAGTASPTAANVTITYHR